MTDNPASDEVYQRGLHQLRVLNPTAPEAILAPLGDLGVDIIRHAFGEIYTRPGLSLRDREVVTVSMLIALDRPDPLRSHFGMALRSGVTVDELKEIVLQSAVYGGYPVAMGAMKVLNEVLETFTG